MSDEPDEKPKPRPGESAKKVSVASFLPPGFKNVTSAHLAETIVIIGAPPPPRGKRAKKSGKATV
jgi:hypothetical protein